MDPEEQDHESDEKPEEATNEAQLEQVIEGLEGGEQRKPLPDELPVLPVHGVLVFPDVLWPAHVAEEDRVKVVEEVTLGNRLFLALTFKGEPTESPGPDDLYSVGTTCSILQMLKFPDGSVRFLARGIQRSRVEEFVQAEPHLRARVSHLEEEETGDVETAALGKNLRGQFVKLADMLPNMGEEDKLMALNIPGEGRLADLVCSRLGIAPAEKQEVLEVLDVKERLQRVTALLTREMDLLEVAQKIQIQARSEIDKGQREYYLRQQLKAIQDELGETDAQTGEMDELRKQLEEKALPEEVRTEAERELDRLGRINPASPEYTVARTYLDWILDLPWQDSTHDTLDLETARGVLEEDHYGLDKIKERILEFLAVRKLREDMKGSILCFVGPPGTGKTSIGKSIARAMGRKYIRISLGGVRDEAEVRGHRRTYIGALPGRIVVGMKKAGSNNPLFMLDEVDKLGADFRGDPASALLEVLDPEQNFSYTDHYLDLPFDLSKVFFICTANILDPLPPALRDRMEVLEFPGYTQEEKLEIAKRYLVPQQVDAHGLKEEKLKFADEALTGIITSYTREAGVRNLERRIGSVCRKVAKEVVMGREESQSIDGARVEELLGPAEFIPEMAGHITEPGVATGLAWTTAGGTVMFVEAIRTDGDGKLTLTGQLGPVMKESAQAALTYTRAHAQDLGIGPEPFGKSDFHIHVPAGAVPKDGPSAGVAMGMALISLCTDRPIRHNLAMTGEITLRGKVLPVGGVKEKVLAATRAGIEIVVLPRDNENDLADIPSYAREKIEFVLVDRVDDVVAAVFDGPQEAMAGSSGSGEEAASAEPATQTAAGKEPAARNVRARKKS